MFTLLCFPLWHLYMSLRHRTCVAVGLPLCLFLCILVCVFLSSMSLFLFLCLCFYVSAFSFVSLLFSLCFSVFVSGSLYLGLCVLFPVSLILTLSPLPTYSLTHLLNSALTPTHIHLNSRSHVQRTNYSLSSSQFSFSYVSLHSKKSIWFQSKHINNKMFV